MLIMTNIKDRQVQLFWVILIFVHMVVHLDIINIAYIHKIGYYYDILLNQNINNYQYTLIIKYNKQQQHFNILKIYNHTKYYYQIIIQSYPSLQMYYKNNNIYTVNQMKNIKLSFHHPNFIYNFKIDLHISDVINMLSMDPHKIIHKFNTILNVLILTQQQKNIMESLSLGFKKQFIGQYQNQIKKRINVDYVGQNVGEYMEYFVGELRGGTQYVRICKQLYIYLNRQTNQLQQFKNRFNNLQSYQLLYKFVAEYQNSQQLTKQNVFIFYTCISTIILTLYKSHTATDHQKQIIDYINKILLIGYDNLLIHYNHTHLTTYIQTLKQIWQQLLNTHKQQTWLYKKHQTQVLTSSVLKTIIQTLKPQNKNYKSQSQMLKIVHKILQKCQIINQLLLFITQCINLRIMLRLEQFSQSINLHKFNILNSIYLILPKNLSEDFGKKIIRVKQKYIMENNFKNQLNLGKQILKELISRFMKFKNGKIENKKQKQKQKQKQKEVTLEIPYKKQRQRDRIRKQSFIMTNFQQIKHKYQETLIHEDQNSRQYKLAIQNMELLEMNKSLQQKINDKDKSIMQLEAAVAEFVDVKKKYIRQNILKFCSKTYQFQVDSKFYKLSSLYGQISNKENANNKDYKIQDKKYAKINQSPEKLNNGILPNLPPPPTFTTISNNLIISPHQPPSSTFGTLPPPPPPPSNLRQSRNLRASRNSKQVHILPPPPSLSLLNQLSPPFLLPPPPPILPFSLSPTKTNKNRPTQRKDVKMINWTAVEISKVKDSFWQSIDNVQFNENELISFFAKKEDKDKIIEAPKIIVAAQKHKKSLLRPERAKNIQIILKKTRISIFKIPYAVEQLDQQTLTPQNIDSLLNIIPTPQEAEIFIQLRIVDPDEWSNADLYFCLIAKISGYAEILRALRFKYQFQHIEVQTIQKLNQFQNFFKDVQKDQILKSYLSYLLALGNFMNSDTSKGNAYGIKLQSLQKSYMLLGQDKKTSLFQYILQLMIQKGIKFNEKNYYRPQKITPIQILKIDLTQIRKQCRNVQQCLLTSRQDDLRTTQVFLSFYIQSRQKITVLDIKFNECLNIFNKVSDFYCQKMESQKMVKIINDFRGKIYNYIQTKKIDTKK